ncbi:hypothetical protein RM697_05925 [Ichthyenterobacterium sp. W332]|uniref:Uncharacterized protein n=1 Tax=Microcosmobacter mediterraneus TaxID=3075607 RepID=A0ABU2YJ24_9FLAO|nr:hypothetical protein [Ichthyenterobacterium sp. W332]MDT0558173.1 hypothetical protein [Ichthyenterobacterium sp. W332]
MKLFNIIFTLVAIALIVFNTTKINFNAPFKGDSMVAIITIVAGLCAILVVQILMISRRIEEKSKGK